MFYFLPKMKFSIKYSFKASGENEPNPAFGSQTPRRTKNKNLQKSNKTKNLSKVDELFCRIDSHLAHKHLLGRLTSIYRLAFRCKG